MKHKLFLTIPMAMAMMMSSCDMEVPSSDISSALTDVGRCGVSKGIPLTAQQAKKIKLMVDLINTKKGADSITSTDIAGELNSGCSSPSTVAGALETIRKGLNGQTLYHNTAMMKSLYELTYKYYDPGSEEQDTYCACGYEFCDLGVGCATDTEMNMQICSSNTSLVADKAKGVVESDIACNPVNLSFETLKQTLVEHQLPLLMHMAYFRAYEGNIGTDKASTIITKESYEGDDYTAQKVTRAKEVYQLLIECVNAADKATLDDNGDPVTSCVTLKNENALYKEGSSQSRKCLKKDTNGKTSRIEGTRCAGEIYLAAANPNANFYSTVRSLAKKSD